MKVAIIQSFRSIHYEVLGCLLQYFDGKEEHDVTMYLPANGQRDDWVSFYRSIGFFKTVKLADVKRRPGPRTCAKFIFPTDDDPVRLREYADEPNVYVIEHTRGRSGLPAERVMPIRCHRGEGPLALTCFDGIPRGGSCNARSGCVCIGDNEPDPRLLSIAARNADFVHISRKRNKKPTVVMMQHLREAKVCLVARRGGEYIHDRLSGVIPLAFSAGTPVLMHAEMARSMGIPTDACLTFEDDSDDSELLRLMDVDPAPLAAGIERVVREAVASYGRVFDAWMEARAGPYDFTRILHCMWLDEFAATTTEVPLRYAANVAAWQRFNGDCALMSWSASSVSELVTRHFPAHAPAFERLRPLICKCDIARFVVLYAHGGLYFDLDFHCLRPVGKLLDGKRRCFFREPPEHEERHGKALVVNGLAYVRERGDEFVRAWIEQMFANVAQCGAIGARGFGACSVVSTTGPAAFAAFCEASKEVGFDLEVHPDTCSVLPFTDRGRKSSACAGSRETYAYTKWSDGTHWGRREGAPAHVRFVRRFTQEPARDRSCALIAAASAAAALIVACAALLAALLLRRKYARMRERPRRALLRPPPGEPGA